MKPAGFSLVLFACMLAALGCAPSPPPAVAPGRDFQYYMDFGTSRMRDGDYGQAAAAFGRAVEINPRSARALNFLGICQLHEKDYQSARGQFEKAAAEDPSFAQAFGNLGSLDFIERKFSEARKLFEKAIQLDPRLASAYYSLGSMLLLQGHSEDGLKYLSKGFELAPDYLEKHAASTVNFSMDEFKSSEYFFSLARLYAMVGKPEKTLEYLEKAEEAGFREWERMASEKDFDNVRADPRIRDFLRSKSLSD